MCQRTTYTTDDGDATQTSSNTSMSQPGFDVLNLNKNWKDFAHDAIWVV